MATRTKTQTAQAIPEATQDAEISHIELLRSMASMAGVEIPSGRQILIGAALSVIVGVAGGYVAASLATYVMAGALLFTGSAFIALIAMVITYVIGIYLTWRVGSQVVTWAMSGSIQSDVSNAKNWVTSKFASMRTTPGVPA